VIFFGLMSGKNKAKYIKIEYKLPSIGAVVLYNSPSIKNALEHITEDMTIYGTVKLGMVLEAMFEAGAKAGRAEVVSKLKQIESETNYLPPGKPAKNTKAPKKKSAKTST
jgi:hypothetical protein